MGLYPSPFVIFGLDPEIRTAAPPPTEMVLAQSSPQTPARTALPASSNRCRLAFSNVTNTFESGAK